MSNRSNAINNFIKIAEDSECYVIKVDDVAKTLLADPECISEAKRIRKSELLEKYYKLLIAVSLHDAGYRSAVKGKGYYVNVEKCNDAECLARFLNNARFSIIEKQAIENILKETVKNKDQIEGQFVFDPFTMTYETSSTDEELLERLKMKIG